jgi:poly(3-hydroxybutyrate) depolymerase
VPTNPALVGNATCHACPGEPCTRPCLPALDSGGPAPPTAYSRGTCPALVPGTNRDFGANHRDFELRVPATSRGPYGVVFAWHHSNGSSELFPRILADHLETGGYVLVAPDGQRRYPLEWDMDAAGADDDLRFFDDVLACLDAQIPIDRRRVHAVGLSAGAVFSAYLMGRRSNVLASFVSFSGGGEGPGGERFVPNPPHPIPGLLYHGGETDVPDWAGRVGTLALARRMAANTQLAIVCDHGSGHVIPGPAKTLDDMWAFMLAHPFSPGNTAAWRTTGITGLLPDYCRIQQ